MRGLPLLGMPKPQQIKRKQTTIKGIPETKLKKENNENIHLPNASGSKIRSAGQMPKVRNGVNTKRWIT